MQGVAGISETVEASIVRIVKCFFSVQMTKQMWKASQAGRRRFDPGRPLQSLKINTYNLAPSRFLAAMTVVPKIFPI